MKKLIALIPLILILISGCSKDPLRSDLDDSRDAWLKFKKANNNSYSYTATFGSWTGFSTTTTIVVIHGIVTERIYKLYITDGQTGQTKLDKSWTEDKSTLNTHPHQAAETWTLDEVYDRAKNIWLKVDKDQNKLYFEAKNNGMISLCGYVPNNCADDCLVGIQISEIKPLVGGKYIAVKLPSLYAPNDL